ncbi:hypothetical protein ACS0TY_006109 [Phlomoides rotata]
MRALRVSVGGSTNLKTKALLTLGTFLRSTKEHARTRKNILISSTALMQACRYGHWKVVQSLLLFRCNAASHLWFRSPSGSSLSIRQILRIIPPKHSATSRSH